MDFANKAFAQIGDLFKSMTPGARILAGLLLAVVVALLAHLYSTQVSGGEDFLMGGRAFSSEEHTAIQGALGKAGLPFEVEGMRIRVPKGRQHVYMAALVDGSALPADFGDYLAKAVQTTPFTSRASQAAAIRNAKQLEVSRILGKLEWVQSANVMFAPPEKSGLQQKGVATASVTIMTKGGDSLTGEKVRALQRFVANSLGEGLSMENVSVMDQSGHSMGGVASGSTTSAEEDLYASRTRHYEDQYIKKARNQLDHIPGVMISATVTLDAEIHREEVDYKVDPKTIPIEEETTTSKETSNTGSSGGRVGLAAQGNTAAKVPEPSPTSNMTKEGPDTERKVSTASRTQTNASFAGLTPKIVKYAISVPITYYEKIWRQENKKTDDSRPSTDIEKAALSQIETREQTRIRSVLTALLPNTDKTTDPTPNVEVATYLPLDAPPIEAPGMAAEVLPWLGAHWGTLGLIGLALFSLMMLRSMVKAPATAAPKSGVVIDLPATAAGGAAAGSSAQADASGATVTVEGEKPKAKIKRKFGGGASLRDELVELVREDPDTAANILRDWIGEAA